MSFESLNTLRAQPWARLIWCLPGQPGCCCWRPAALRIPFKFKLKKLITSLFCLLSSELQFIQMMKCAMQGTHFEIRYPSISHMAYPTTCWYCIPFIIRISSTARIILNWNHLQPKSIKPTTVCKWWWLLLLEFIGATDSIHHSSNDCCCCWGL